ncbi:uncharacterized protein LOC120357019 [Solenopsis invicta]|uniref:uncharacterized protein LOC120357019 n=1 Tax=Solenopsis invicta TaxID=13686 RepID=UPI00193D67B2|nr:uncharacterized protein LOC120357019 [Solenopsis invicta]
MMVKVEWFCIVPSCKSNSRTPGHFFPKSPILSEKWKEAVNNSIILNISSEELRKYRVCHLHFLPEDYIYIQNRRRLKHNTVSSVNIYNTQTVTNSTEINDANRETNDANTEINDATDIQLHSQSETNTELHLQSQTSNEPGPSTSNFICAETNMQNDQNNITNKVNSPSRISRNILGSVTRQRHLTPKAQKIYKKAVTLAKEKNRIKRQIIDYKTRLKDAKKLSNTQFCKKFNSLTPTQRLFFNMQLRNTKYAPKVHFKTLFNELKSSLESICPERSSQYFSNIYFDSETYNNVNLQL